MRKIIAISLFALMVSTTVSAQSTVGRCVYEHRECASECLELDSEGSQAACVAKCAGLEAQCVSAVGVKSSEPFLRKKADQLEDMIQEFFGDILPTLPEDKPTENKKKSSSDT